MADPILKLASSRGFPQLLKIEKKVKEKEKYNSSLQDLNPDLPIQSQVCLPLDQGFMKIAKKNEKILTRFIKIKILDDFV